MLVPLVLRNIVLPYLRSGSHAGVAAAQQRRQAATSAVAAAAHAHARVEAVERDDVRWEPFCVGPRVQQVIPVHRRPPNKPPSEPPSRAVPLPQAEAPQPASKPEPEQPEQPREQEGSRRSQAGGEPHPTSKPPSSSLTSTSTSTQKAKTKRRPLPPRKPTDVDLSRVHIRHRAIVMPVPLRKLLDAKLFRAAVFSLLETPEWMGDEELVLAVVDRLEDKGALQLAHRLRRTLERGAAAGTDGRVRLWSDPVPKNRPRAPPDNRVPLVPRRAYPEPTEQGRRTHHWNLLLTQWLTVRHSIPYASPFPRQRPDGHTPAPARLRRLRDVLHTIDRLRATRGFVPDRVTANIVLKAYLSCLARGTVGEGRDAHPLPFRAGLRSEDLREVFRLIAASIEEGLDKGLVVHDEDEGKGKRKNKGKVPLADLDILEKFDAHVSYEAHVQPFTRMMGRAMARVGDHRGRAALEKWGETMRERIYKLQECEEAAGKAVGSKEAKRKGEE
ncbi:hypothetical protein CcaverHIS002_0606080 [Cutaneotrichosporon cavernicola]|uniref:Uncharacterized protein n=1 Tax=Cutaneotrichosporon cavernicola TaxID=279322 RepID=A0AA48QY95_9TREE|nr:uncharacterized protein CcaverHIS019_0605540 [Cutaneotrichosporon cavernicola]BEI86321.1 hypothetical protein CcaverHIS002_0606080 [Cutaneotrichosporon cavernicola]BEI94095.1 hypothetical protein CcaverHIS019_0605540 [Cutaneotrichosporon cavernicola]BEJ01874.1 hypothetical protein CcaverHIS631_0605560 [Cutaneotrichosporon cavernicola]BEJ09639.1 hypothetical protein CcaverHIS641_0605540 [Cutaneotrichosporon cavernicola]